MRKIEIRFAAGVNLQNGMPDFINLLNCCQKRFHFIGSVDPQKLNIDQIEPFPFLAELNSKQQAPLIFITNLPLSDNYFAHCDGKVAIVTTNQWMEYFGFVSIRSYLILEIAQQVLQIVLGFDFENVDQLVHKEPIGCINDGCNDKDQIASKLAAGYICAIHKATLLQLGAYAEDITAVESMIKLSRNQAIGAPSPLNPLAVFVAMKFSEHDENANSFNYGIKLGIEAAGLQCIRVDDQHNPFPLFENITRGIESSPFFLAKLDPENSNVYLELGLAMGKRKEVLYISEESFIAHLPADLKAQTILTYPQGNFNALKEKITQFYTRRMFNPEL